MGGYYVIRQVWETLFGAPPGWAIDEDGVEIDGSWVRTIEYCDGKPGYVPHPEKGGMPIPPEECPVVLVSFEVILGRESRLSNKHRETYRSLTRAIGVTIVGVKAHRL